MFSSYKETCLLLEKILLPVLVKPIVDYALHPVLYIVGSNFIWSYDVHDTKINCSKSLLQRMATVVYDHNNEVLSECIQHVNKNLIRIQSFERKTGRDYVNTLDFKSYDHEYLVSRILSEENAFKSFCYISSKKKLYTLLGNSLMEWNVGTGRGILLRALVVGRLLGCINNSFIFLTSALMVVDLFRNAQFVLLSSLPKNFSFTQNNHCCCTIYYTKNGNLRILVYTPSQETTLTINFDITIKSLLFESSCLRNNDMLYCLAYDEQNTKRKLLKIDIAKSTIHVREMAIGEKINLMFISNEIGGN